MKASALQTGRRPALRVVRLEPGDWAQTWEDRPREGVAVGLRLISDAEEDYARKRAAEAFDETKGPAQAPDAFNDALVGGIVGAAMCSPNDASQDPECLPVAVETVRQALTSRAIRRLYHELDALNAEASPAARHADDEEIADLVAILADPDLAITNRARRLLAAVLDELTDE